MGKMLFVGKIKGMKNGNVKLDLYGSCSEIRFFMSFSKTTPRSCANLWLGALKGTCCSLWGTLAPQCTKEDKE